MAPDANLKPPPVPIPNWACEDNLGGLVPSEIRVALRERDSARDQQWLALVGALQRDAERLRTLYLAVQSDGYGWWTPDWCIKEGETAPTFDQFRSQIDTERAAIDAARGEKGGV